MLLSSYNLGASYYVYLLTCLWCSHLQGQSENYKSACGQAKCCIGAWKSVATRSTKVGTGQRWMGNITNDGMVNGRWYGDNIPPRVCGISWDNTTIFARTSWEKPRNISVRITGIMVKISSRFVPSTKQGATLSVGSCTSSYLNSAICQSATKLRLLVLYVEAQRFPSQGKE